MSALMLEATKVALFVLQRAAGSGRTSIAPQNDSSPSPCEKCRSPTLRFAPSTKTGNQHLLPCEIREMSELPARRRGSTDFAEILDVTVLLVDDNIS